MSSSPLIGVSTSEVRRAVDAHFARESEPRQRELALGTTYLDAIARAGGLPVILSPLDDAGIDALLDRLQGVCLSGGPDLHPSAYGAEPHPHLGPTEPELDVFELRLAQRARERGVPLLAICRGAQVLNVSRGGTLHQHLPDVIGDEVVHRQTDVAERVTHRVDVDPDSRLAALLGAREIEVNSFHHQAVDRLGEGLRIVARAPDGTVEGLEATEPGFTVGVQWHAECLVERPEQMRLLRAFVRAAARPVVGPALSPA